MYANDFVESYFDAWNHRDPKAVADHLTADGFYRDIPEKQQRTHDELIVSLKDFFTRHRHRYEVIGEILASGETIAFQYRIKPFGHESSSRTYRGAEFITLSGEAAITITDYYDMPVAKRSSKYAKSGLTSDQMTMYKASLSHIMQTQQAFLRPDLTLPSLADAVGCSVNHLSQVINAGFGMSFFDYLNGYRVELAKQLLAEHDGQSSAILNIAFNVGFNSNSAFYSAFKKMVGQTPAQYRRQILKLNQFA